MTLTFRDGGEPLAYYHRKNEGGKVVKGSTGYVTVSGPGTNFGARISSEQVLKAFSQLTPGESLPFDIMAAGYGQDEDWVGLGLSDVLDDTNSLSETLISAEALDATDWGPFEVYATNDAFEEGFIVSPPEWVTMKQGPSLSGSQAMLDIKTPKVDSIVPADVLKALSKAGYVIVHPDLSFPGFCPESDTGYHYISTGLCSGCLQVD